MPDAIVLLWLLWLCTEMSAAALTCWQTSKPNNYKKKNIKTRICIIVCCLKWPGLSVTCFLSLCGSSIFTFLSTSSVMSPTSLRKTWPSRLLTVFRVVPRLTYARRHSQLKRKNWNVASLNAKASSLRQTCPRQRKIDCGRDWVWKSVSTVDKELKITFQNGV